MITRKFEGPTLERDMNKNNSIIQEVFGQHHAVLPVIHVANARQSLANAEIAREAGADGVFLINHDVDVRTLLEIWEKVSAAHPGWWIGVNLLGVRAADVFDLLPVGVSGVWVDNAEIDERSGGQERARLIDERRRASGWSELYFGGVAFKYQREVDDLHAAARAAAPWMDVVTTSGPGTGEAADLAKITALKYGLGSKALAIASGITPDNVSDYLPLADAFLVATGISRSFTFLDPPLVADLVKRVRAYSDKPVRMPDRRRICFVCKWNEGRSVHLEMAVRRRLALIGHANEFEITSAGLYQGGGIGTQRRVFLLRQGVPESEIRGHQSRVFEASDAASDLILVAEKNMGVELMERWPETRGRVMTIRGFAAGRGPENDLDSPSAHIEDADGHTDAEKEALYEELETIAASVAARLLCWRQTATRYSQPCE